VDKDWFRTKAIDEHTWMIFGRDEGCTSYLLVGDDYGMMIDAGFGGQNIHAFAEKLAGKTVKFVANTHGHFDHTGGNGWFPCALMSRGGAGLAREGFRTRDLPGYNDRYPVFYVEPGFEMDLGGRMVEVLPLGNHSPGSIGFLDKTHRILFTGDDIGWNSMLIYKIKEPQPSVLKYAMCLSNLMRRRGEYDICCSGHAAEPVSADIINHSLTAALLVLDGELGEPIIFTPPPMDENGKPRGFVMPEPEFKRCAEYKDVRFSYDARYVRDLEDHPGLLGT